MQKIVNGVAQQVLGTCRCPQCTPRHMGNAVKSYHSSVAPRRILTGSTIFATAGFAVASTMEISTKTQRREQWNTALADVSDRVREQTLRNDQWQTRIGVDDATIAEHLRRDEEYGYLFGDELYGDTSDEPKKSSQQTEAANRVTRQHQENLYHYPWSQGDKVAPNRVAAEMLEKDDVIDVDKPGFLTYHFGGAAEALQDAQDSDTPYDPFSERRVVTPDDRIGRDWAFELLNEDYIPRDEFESRPDPDMQRSVELREKYGADLDGDGPLAYLEQLNRATLDSLAGNSPERAKAIGANAAMANVLARNHDFYTEDRIRLISGGYTAPDGQVVSDLRAGLPDLSDSDVLLDLAVSRAFWTVNTGDRIRRQNLTRRSVHRWQQFPGGTRVTTNSVKKSERIKLCVNQLECLMLESLREASHVVGEEALTSQVQDTLRTFKRNVIRREHSYLWRDMQRLYQADEELRNYWQRPVSLPLAEYKSLNEVYIPQNLNDDLRTIFRSCTPDKEGRVRTLCHVWEALNTSDTTPEGFTFDILIAGLSDCGFDKLTNLAISAMRMCKLQPNEATMGIILGHYARVKQADKFEHWIRIMMGHHGGISLYDENDFFDEKLFKPQARPDDQRPGDKLVLKPLPNSLMFDAVIKGTLKLYGLAETLDRAKRWAIEGWGLSMISLTAIGKAAAALGERGIALEMLQLADALSTRSETKRDPHWGHPRLEAVPQELFDAVASVYRTESVPSDIEGMIERAKVCRRRIAASKTPHEQRNLLRREFRIKFGDLDERMEERKMELTEAGDLVDDTATLVETRDLVDDTATLVAPQQSVDDGETMTWQPDAWSMTTPVGGEQRDKPAPTRSTQWSFSTPLSDITTDNSMDDSAKDDIPLEGSQQKQSTPTTEMTQQASPDLGPVAQPSIEEDLFSVIREQASRAPLVSASGSMPTKHEHAAYSKERTRPAPNPANSTTRQLHGDEKNNKTTTDAIIPPPSRKIEWTDELYY